MGGGSQCPGCENAVSQQAVTVTQTWHAPRPSLSADLDPAAVRSESNVVSNAAQGGIEPEVASHMQREQQHHQQQSLQRQTNGHSSSLHRRQHQQHHDCLSGSEPHRLELADNLHHCIPDCGPLSPAADAQAASVWAGDAQTGPASHAYNTLDDLSATGQLLVLRLTQAASDEDRELAVTSTYAAPAVLPSLVNHMYRDCR